MDTEAGLHALEERLRVILRELAVLQETKNQLEYEVIHLVHDLGMTWASIGEAHNPPISRERATKRYSHPKPRRTPRGG